MKIYGIELKEGEGVIKIVRHHWLSFFRPLINSIIILLVAGFIITQTLPGSQSVFRRIFEFENKMVWAFWVVLLIGLIYFFVSFQKFRSNALLVTDQRVIYNNVKGSFSKTVNEVSHQESFDLVYQVKGFWPTFFRYGDLIIKTENSRWVFKKVERPEKVKDLIIGQKLR